MFWEKIQWALDICLGRSLVQQKQDKTMRQWIIECHEEKRALLKVGKRGHVAVTPDHALNERLLKNARGPDILTCS